MTKLMVPHIEAGLMLRAWERLYPVPVRCYRGVKIYRSQEMGVPLLVAASYPYAVIRHRPADDAPMLVLDTLPGLLSEIDDGRPGRISIKVRRGPLVGQFPYAIWSEDGIWLGRAHDTDEAMQLAEYIVRPMEESADAH